MNNIQSIFKDFSVDGTKIPVKRLFYHGHGEPFITYQLTDEDNSYSGDDDMLGEVERIYVYRICPICQKKEVQSKHFLRIIREWKRCDYKK